MQEDVKLVGINAEGSPVSVNLPDLKAYILQVDEPEVPDPVTPPTTNLFLGGGNSGIAKTTRMIELRSSYSDEVLGVGGRIGFFGHRDQARIDLLESFYKLDIICPNLSGARNTAIEFAFGLGDANTILSKTDGIAYFSINKDGNNVDDEVRFSLGIDGQFVGKHESQFATGYPSAEKITLMFYPGHLRVVTYFGIFHFDYRAEIHGEGPFDQFNFVVSVSSFNESPTIKTIHFEEGVALPLNEMPALPVLEEI